MQAGDADRAAREARIAYRIARRLLEGDDSMTAKQALDAENDAESGESVRRN